MFHPTITFTAGYFKEEVNVLDLNIKLIDGKLKTDLFVKPTDTHQFLDPISSHPYHCKKGIPYSQASSLNRICSDNTNFDKRCNNLEKWLMQRGYNKKMINNYKSKHRAFRKGNWKVPRKLFHTHYCLDDHSGIEDWDFGIFEQCKTHAQLKERETFWQHRLKTFYPIGLNEKEEYLY